MTIDELKALRDSGKFHHATYRDHGTVWEGYHIYVHSQDGFRGFTHAGAIHKDSPDLQAAYELLRNSGYSVGSYGNG